MRKTGLTNNQEFINAGILRFSKCVFAYATLFFLLLKTDPSWVSIKTLSCGRAYSCILIIVFCILYLIFYKTCVVIDSRMCFAAAKHLDRQPLRVCFEHKYTKYAQLGILLI